MKLSDLISQEIAGAILDIKDSSIFSPKTLIFLGAKRRSRRIGTHFSSFLPHFL
jgi:hypothetical protein